MYIVGIFRVYSSHHNYRRCCIIPIVGLATGYRYSQSASREVRTIGLFVQYASAFVESAIDFMKYYRALCQYIVS